MPEFGLFSDEGLIEAGFYDVESADAARRAKYPDDDLTISEVCPDHPDHAREFCEDCEGDVP